MRTFEIACGAHHGTILATGPGAAWRKLTKGKTEGFAPLARFREIPGVWQYIAPEALDELKP